MLAHHRSKKKQKRGSDTTHPIVIDGMDGYFKHTQQKNNTIYVGILENTSKQLSDAIITNRKQFCRIKNELVNHIGDNNAYFDKADAKKSAKNRLSMFEKKAEHDKNSLSILSSDSSSVLDS